MVKMCYGRKEHAIFRGKKCATLYVLMSLWSVVTYGSEGWIIHKAEEKQIEAFEMWCCRRVLRVSWIDQLLGLMVVMRMTSLTN